MAVPKIRFPGFTEDWEQRKLEELCDFERGQGLSWSDIDDSDGKNECILYGNLYTDYDTVIEKVKHKTNIKGTVRSKKFDVLIPGSDTTPTGLARALCVVNDGVILGGDINILHPHVDVEGRFLAFALNSRKKELIKRIKGTTVRHLQNKDLFDVLVNIPKSKEQEKIAELLLSFDHLITLHQRKLESMKLLKKSLLQKMFPKSGETVPEVRFPGFTDAWEQRKLGEISEKVTTKNQDMVVNEVFTNSAEYGIISQQDFFDKDIANSNKVDGYYLVEPDDFVYNPRISNSAPFGPIKRNKLGRSGAMSPLYYVFRSHDVDKSYLDWFFQTNRWHAFMRFHGNTGVRSDRFAITDKIFAEMTISIPQDIDEQKAIGTFFTALDDSITLHQRKLDGMKLLKKSLLQKMFPKNGESVPEVRFPGFTDAWAQSKFGPLVTIERGGSPRPIDRFITDSPNGLNWVKIGDAPKQGNYITKTAEKIRPEGLSKTREVHPGDLILSNSMSFGKPYIMAINGCIHDGWLAIRNYQNSFDLKFLCVLLGTSQMLSQYKAMAAGSTVNNLNKELVGSTMVKFPCLDEQRKIGRFFESFEDSLSINQREIDELQKLKTSFSQQMFV